MKWGSYERGDDGLSNGTTFVKNKFLNDELDFFFFFFFFYTQNCSLWELHL